MAYISTHYNTHHTAHFNTQYTQHNFAHYNTLQALHCTLVFTRLYTIPTLSYSEVGPNLIRWPQSPKYFDTLIELEAVWTLESWPQNSFSLQTCKISEQKSLPGTQAATFNANFLFIVFSFSFLCLKLWFHLKFMFRQSFNLSRML